jgi:hypothetical protein
MLTSILYCLPPNWYNRSQQALKKVLYIMLKFILFRVEAGSNTSTVALPVVEGDEKGRLESETENMVASQKGLGPENDRTGKGQQQL